VVLFVGLINPIGIIPSEGFNCIDRREVDAALREFCPERLPYFQTLYGLDTELILAGGTADGLGKTITASRGVTPAASRWRHASPKKAPR